jgi:hypothetical protein
MEALTWKGPITEGAGATACYLAERRLVMAGKNGARIVMWLAAAVTNSLYLLSNVPSCRNLLNGFQHILK